MSETKDYWSGQEGASYHARNRVDWRLRAKTLFTGLMDHTGARSVLEVGCGPGWNLSACRLDPRHHYVTTHGMDLHRPSLAQARNAGHEVINVEKLPVYEEGYFDLTMTVGMHIRVPPGELTAMMINIANASSQYVLAAEYHAEEEEEVEYRGKKGLLWKRNYRRLYEDLGLKHHMSGFLGPEHGFDNITWTLLTR